MSDTKKPIDTKHLENGKFWVVVEKDHAHGKDGLSVHAVSDSHYKEMVSKFDVAKLSGEIIMAHRC